MNELLEQMCQRVLRHADEKRPATAIPRLAIGMSRHTMPVVGALGPGVCLILQGAKHMLVGNKMLHYGAGACFASVIELPTTFSVLELAGDRPYIGTGLALDQDVFSTLLAEVPEVPAQAGAMAFNVGPVSRDVLEAWDHLLVLLDSPADIPVLAAARERELHYRLLQSAHGPLLRQIAREEGRLAQVRRGIAWMRDHFDQSFAIETVAGIAGMSVPSFNRHFRAATSTSPLQYQKTLRLQAARRMLAAAVDATRAAYAVGYESPSQFSREYARLYGRAPKQDAAHMRQHIGNVAGIVL